MLYLLRTYGEDGVTKLKVGYTDDFKTRLSQYRSANPFIKVIETREGDIIDETLFHLYLHFLGYSWKLDGLYLDEWYDDNPEVIDIFSNSLISEIEELAWKNRQSLFSTKDFRSTPGTKSLSLLLFERLFEKFGQEIIMHEVVTVSDDGKFHITKKTSEKIDEYYYNNYLPKPQIDNTGVPSKVLVSLDEFSALTIFTDKLKYMCNTKFSGLELEVFMSRLPDTFQNYYRVIGIERIKALGYNRFLMDSEYKSRVNNQDIENLVISEVYNNFKEGEKYTKSFIKEKLKEIYSNLGYISTPKANDLEKYFTVKPCLLPNKDTGKRDSGFEIIKKI